MSEDGTQPGGAGLMSDAATELVDTTAGAEDLHLDGATATAIDAGVVLSTLFVWDIDTQGRGNANWDMGADEFNGTNSVSLRVFEATGGDGEVQLSWETASEINVSGFYLYRSETVDGSTSRSLPIPYPRSGTRSLARVTGTPTRA